MLVGKATELFLAKLARDGYKKSQEADRRQVGALSLSRHTPSPILRTLLSKLLFYAQAYSLKFHVRLASTLRLTRVFSFVVIHSCATLIWQKFEQQSRSFRF